jgi:uncharacterized protein (UPF0548 family)
MALQGPDHQQNVPRFEAFVEKGALQRLGTAAQPDHTEPVSSAEAEFSDALADQARVGRQQDFRHADCVRVVGEITPAQGQRLETQTLVGALRVDCRVETNIDQSHIAGAQFGSIPWIEQFGAEPPLPFDADHGGAVAISGLLQFLQRATHKRRVGPDAQPVFSPRELVVANEIEKGCVAYQSAVFWPHPRPPSGAPLAYSQCR